MGIVTVTLLTGFTFSMAVTGVQAAAEGEGATTQETKANDVSSSSEAPASSSSDEKDPAKNDESSVSSSNATSVTNTSSTASSSQSSSSDTASSGASNTSSTDSSSSSSTDDSSQSSESKSATDVDVNGHSLKFDSSSNEKTAAPSAETKEKAQVADVKKDADGNYWLAVADEKTGVNTYTQLTDYSYSQSTDSSTYTITGYTGELQKYLAGGTTPEAVSAKDITLPDTYNGDPITAVADGAFNYQNVSGAVTISNSITNIGSNAFANNDITTLNLGKGVQVIGDDAFSRNTSDTRSNNDISTVIIPDSVTTIGDRAFANVQIKQLQFGDSVSDLNSKLGTIGVDAFSGNQISGVITVPGSVTSIAMNAFADNQISIVMLGQKIDTIGQNTFDPKTTVIAKDADGNYWTLGSDLKTYTLLTDYKYALNVDGTYTITDYTGNLQKYLGAESQDGSIANLTIPSTYDGKQVTEIGAFVFNNKNITGTVTIPDSITKIDNDAFANNDITTLNLGKNVQVIGEDAFSIQKSNANPDRGISAVTIPDSVTSIGQNAFTNNRITQLQFGDSASDSSSKLETIGEDAFSGNQISGALKIPDSVTTIDQNAFVNNQISAVTLGLGEKVDAIGQNAFDATVVVKDADGNYWSPVTDPTSGEVTSYTQLTDYSYTSNDDGTYTITGYTGNLQKYLGTESKDELTNLTLPSTYDGKKITEIGANAFNHKSISGSVTIPDSIIKIDSDAFANNDITTLDLGKGVQIIGEDAFSRNPSDTNSNNNISTVIIPDSVISIGQNAFTNDRIKHLQFGDTDSNSKLETIGEDAFSGNQIGGTVTIPDGVTLIGMNAFMNNQISGLTIGKSVQTIGMNAFVNNQIRTVALGQKVDIIGQDAFDGNTLVAMKDADGNYWKPTMDQDGKVTYTQLMDYDYELNSDGTYTIAKYTGDLQKYLGTESHDVMLPSTYDGKKVTEIADGAFADAGISGKIVIPDTVTSIGQDAFTRNKISAVVLGSNVKTIGQDAFSANQISGTINVPDSVTNIGTRAFTDNNITGLTLGKSVQTIGEDAFSVNRISGPVVVPDSVTSIGTRAFTDNNITGLTLGKSVQTIGEDAFSVNRISGPVVVPDLVTSIGTRAFTNNQINGLILGKSVGIIGEDAFSGNQISGTVTIPASVTSIGINAFANNHINAVALRQKLDTIGQNAFDPKTTVIAKDADGNYWTLGADLKTYTQLTDYTYTQNSDGTYTITGYNGNLQNYLGTESQDGRLNYLTLPSTYNGKKVTGIGAYAFSDKNITGTVTIPDTVTSIGQDAFTKNTISSVVLGSGVKTIGQDAFSVNRISDTVTIPDSVISIGVRAFAENWISGVKLGNHVQIIGNDAFAHDTSLPNTSHNQISGIVEIPDSVISIGARAFANNQIDQLQFGDTGSDSNSKVAAIGVDAFSGNQIGGSVIIPDSVKLIDMNAFTNNYIEKLTLGRNVQTIGENAFANNKIVSDARTDGATTELFTVPDSVTSIGTHAFFQNQISELYLGTGIHTIGDYAFAQNKISKVTNKSKSDATNYLSDQQALVTVNAHATATQIEKIRAAIEDAVDVTLPDNLTFVDSQWQYDPQTDTLTIPSGGTMPNQVTLQFSSAGYSYYGTNNLVVNLDHSSTGQPDFATTTTVNYETPDGVVRGSMTLIGMPGEVFDSNRVVTHVPTGWQLANPDLPQIVAQTQDQTVVIPLAAQDKTSTGQPDFATTTTVNYETPDGVVRGSMTLIGMSGEVFDSNRVATHVPTGWQLANPDLPQIVAQTQDQTVVIPLAAQDKTSTGQPDFATTTTVNYETPDGVVRGSMILIGMPGEVFDSNRVATHVPTGWQLANPDLPQIVAQTQDQTVIIPLAAQDQTSTGQPDFATTTTVNYETPDGVVRGSMTLIGMPGEVFDSNRVATHVPTGWQLANPDLPQIVAQTQDQTVIIPLAAKNTASSGPAVAATTTTINYETPDGKTQGSAQLVGTPGTPFDRYRVLESVPAGWQLAVPVSDLPLIVAQAENQTVIIPLVAKTTVSAGPAEVATTTIINYETSDGVVRGSATLIGNPGMSFNRYQILEYVPTGWQLAIPTSDLPLIIAQATNQTVVIPLVAQDDTVTPPATPATPAQPGHGNGGGSTTTTGQSNGQVPTDSEQPSSSTDNGGAVTSHKQPSTSTSDSQAGQVSSGKGSSVTATTSLHEDSNSGRAVERTVATSNSTPSKHQTDPSKTQLPQTDETTPTQPTLIGGLLLSILGWFGLARRKHEKD
ncbi:leucine-rich repeat domain-containing protein [Secundilactobacillus silagincola]|nr:leucine-rich repeat domain-containing protein [Secundilactobacillus silagincola]